MTTQEVTLDQLEQKLNLLDQNSTEQQQTLLTLNNQLNDCKTALATTKERLVKAEISLQQADDLLKKNDQSLQKLTQQIQALKHHYHVSMLQNVVKSVIGGFVIGYIVHDK